MNRIQKFLMAGTAALGALSFANAASAADLPMKAAPMYAPAPIYNWSGFYVGGHVGAGWGTTEADATVAGTTYSVNGAPFQAIPGTIALTAPFGQTQMNGFLGGLQAGYNWQAGVVVFGLEGDITWSGVKGSTACVLILNCTAEVKWIGDITGRAGVTVGDKGLLYLKGGAAWAQSSYGVNQSAAASGLGLGFGGASAALTGSVSNDRFGGVLGAGIEYGFMPGWSVKLEYDYYDFGKANLTMPITATGTIGGATGNIRLNLPITVTEQVHTIRAGLNYHFNTPVVAKY